MESSFNLLVFCYVHNVESNPGPYACSVCGLNVSDESRAVCCDSCDDVYDNMVHQPSEDKWYCSVCMSNCSHSSECSAEDT